MLHILISIIKILGVLLLAVLGIILTVCALVLLVPLRYRGDITFSGSPSGTVFISWLLHFFTIRLEFGEENIRQIRLLGFMLFKEDSNEQESRETEEPTEQKEITNEAETAPKIPQNADVHERQKRDPEVQAFEERRRKVKREKKTFHARLQNFWKKADKKIKEIIRNFQNLRDKAEKIRDFCHEPKNQKMMHLVTSRISKLLHHIFPKKLRGRIHFGFDDPYITGKILTYISPFYGFYGRNFEIEPVFDEKVLEGEIHAKGHIRIISVLWNIVRLFLNKEFRNLLQTIRGKRA